MKQFHLLGKLVCVCCLLFTSSFALAGTIIVTSSAGIGPGTLREAVTMAADGDTIKFSPMLDGSTITLASPIIIDKGLLIRGRNKDNTTITGAGTNQIFVLTTSKRVNIGEMVLTDGLAANSGGAIQSEAELILRNIRIENSRAMGAMSDEGGGAISSSGSLDIDKNCEFMNNEADGAAGSGGAILITGGSAHIVGATFSGNSASRAGGAIEDVSGGGQSLIMNSEFTGNSTGPAPGNGGAIHITGAADMDIRNTSFEQNTAAREGGAVWNGTGVMEISGSMISGNEAQGDAADDGGGGVFNNGGTLMIEGGTVIVNNVATGSAGSGGGVFNAEDGTLSITNSEIRENTANRAGGGIEDASGAAGSVSIRESLLNDNEVFTSPGNGGGFHISGLGDAIIISSSVNDNKAGSEGGGLWNGSGTMRIYSVEISGNTASGDAADNGGGGVFNNGGRVIIRSPLGATTIRDNVADGTSGSGGGILNVDGGTLNIRDAEIIANESNRAGGGIEDASGAGSMFTVMRTKVDSNVTATNPGNGGGIHITGDGNLRISGGTVNGNEAGSEGGGLWNGSGEMAIVGVTINGNTASGDAANNGGGGVFNAGGTVRVASGTVITDNVADGTAGSGGGILNDAGGNLDVNQATVSGNSAQRAGGGIEDASGSGSFFRVTRSTINDNTLGTAPGNGGGIHIGGDGSAMVRSSTLDGNAAVEGGGIWNASGTLTVDACTISNNTASGDDSDQGGGGLYNNGNGTIAVSNNTMISGNEATGAAGSGGGILNNTASTLTINNSTLNGNTANRAGGGIEDVSGAGTTVTITDTDFSLNEVFTSPGNGGAIHITGDGDLTITNGTVANNTAGSEGGGLWNSLGTMTINGTTLNNNEAAGDAADNGGGGLFNNGGTMVVNNAVVTMNSASGTAGSGGGLLTTGGSVTVNGGSIDGNFSNRAGGGVEQIDGSYASTGTLYDNNTTGAAPGNGGAFHVTGMASTVTITGGTVSNNSAANEGGGLWNQSGTTMTVSNVAIMNNTVIGTTAGNGGGGIFNNGGIMNVMNTTIALNTVPAALTAGGGIINAAGGDFTLTASTVSTNSTGGGGGGIANDGLMAITNSTIAFNTAAVGGGYAQGTAAANLDVMGSILASNTGFGIDFIASTGTVNSLDYNLIGIDDQNDFPAQANDIEGSVANPVLANLAPLADNGGMTMTHALVCPSPAVNAGDPGDSSNDQIGQAVFNGRRDMGSFELQAVCPPSFQNDEEVTQSARLLTEGVQIYPNPVGANQVNIALSGAIEGEVILRLLDETGRVRNQRISQAGSTLQYPIADLPNGTYFIQVVSGESVATHRLMILR